MDSSANLEEDPHLQAAILAAIQQESETNRVAGDITRTSSDELRSRRATQLRETRRQELQSLHSQVRSTEQRRWQVQNEKGWVDFSDAEQQMLHVALLAGRHRLQFEARGFPYEFNLVGRQVQRNLMTGKERPIRLAPIGERTRPEMEESLERKDELAVGERIEGARRTCVACTVFLEDGATQCALCGTVQPKVGAEFVPPSLERSTSVASEASISETASFDASEVRSIELCCELAGKTFTDPDFPPVLNGRVTAWHRPREVTFHDGRPLRSREDWQLFRGDPRAEDVKQGSLGDCWFLSALAALAEFRGGRFIRALLPEQTQLNHHGVYVVRLCLGGRWRNVVVDDRFPCSGGGRYHFQFAYCTTYRLQLWASLIEKGFAKACGSYEGIVGGMPDEALSVLTGWPCTVVRFERDDFDRDLLWASLVSSKDASFLMTCSTSDPDESVGLVPNHAYSLIDVIQIAGLQLLKIRNPHASRTWRGAWSESSSEWTSELRGQLGYPEGGSAGIFFMCLADFVRHFTRCTICKIRSDDWCEARALLRIPRETPPSIGYEIEVFESTECAISLCQPQERLREGLYDNLFEPLACTGFVILPRHFPLGTHVSIQKAVVAARMRCKESVSAECWLQPGHTYLLVPLSFHSGASLRLALACVSSRPLVLREARLQAAQVKAAWAAYAKSGPSSEKTECAGGILYLRKSTGAAVVAFAENRGNGFFHTSLAIDSDDLRYSRGLSNTRDWLAPGHGQVLQVAMPSDSRGASWRSKLGTKMAHTSPAPPWHMPEIAEDSLHTPFRL